MISPITSSTTLRVLEYGALNTAMPRCAADDQVDLVGADAEAADRQQVGRRVQHPRGDVGVGADPEQVHPGQRRRPARPRRASRRAARPRSRGPRGSRRRPDGCSRAAAPSRSTSLGRRVRRGRTATRSRSPTAARFLPTSRVRGHDSPMRLRRTAGWIAVAALVVAGTAAATTTGAVSAPGSGGTQAGATKSDARHLGGARGGRRTVRRVLDLADRVPARPPTDRRSSARPTSSSARRRSRADGRTVLAEVTSRDRAAAGRPRRRPLRRPARRARRRPPAGPHTARGQEPGPARHRHPARRPGHARRRSTS